MQVTLYFKETGPDFPIAGEPKREKLRIEIIGAPKTVKRIVAIIRKEISGWEKWEES